MRVKFFLSCSYVRSGAVSTKAKSLPVLSTVILMANSPGTVLCVTPYVV